MKVNKKPVVGSLGSRGSREKRFDGRTFDDFLEMIMSVPGSKCQTLLCVVPLCQQAKTIVHPPGGDGGVGSNPVAGRGQSKKQRDSRVQPDRPNPRARRPSQHPGGENLSPPKLRTDSETSVRVASSHTITVLYTRPNQFVEVRGLKNSSFSTVERRTLYLYST